MGKSSIKIGDAFERKFKFTQEDVENFIRLTGDFNRIHFDDCAASHSPLKVVALPGMLSASIFPAVLANSCIGHNSVYRNQNIKFQKPLLIDTEYLAEIKLVKAHKSRGLFNMSTCIYSVDKSQLYVRGEAMILSYNLELMD